MTPLQSSRIDSALTEVQDAMVLAVDMVEKLNKARIQLQDMKNRNVIYDADCPSDSMELDVKLLRARRMCDKIKLNEES